ncbi:hypothetical protein FDECE_11329 [Fusarium decemcellulare]|nr:hypothetical protein FDECE_11329 [Fusarium decemcellulare]
MVTDMLTNGLEAGILALNEDFHGAPTNHAQERPLKQALDIRASSNDIPLVVPNSHLNENDKRKRPDANDTVDVGGRKGRVKRNCMPSASEEQAKEQRFACPFYKAGIDRSLLSRSCHGPGWTEVHRVKEHISRNHTPASFKHRHVCGRCHEVFQSQEFLAEHLRQEQQCVEGPGNASGKLSLEQFIALRSTRRRSSDLSDEEKWFEWYRIIFPSHNDKDIPQSPYYVDQIRSFPGITSPPSSSDILEYKEYLSGPLAEYKRKEIESDLSTTGISDPALCKVLAAKFREYQLKDVEEFVESKLKPADHLSGNEIIFSDFQDDGSAGNYLELLDLDIGYSQDAEGWRYSTDDLREGWSFLDQV